MEGCNGKKRFTVLFQSLNQQMMSFGDCDPNSNDDAFISPIDGEKFQLGIRDKNGRAFANIFLPEDTLVCNGYYEHERDSFVPVKDFVFK